MQHPEPNKPTRSPATRQRVAVVINFLTHYREDLYRRLTARDDIDLTIYCHLPPEGSSLKSIHEQFAPHVQVRPARFIRGETLVWSSLPWRQLARDYDTVFVEGNPRYLAFALLATWLRLCGKRVVLWTMVQSFRNHPGRQRLRLAWTRAFDRLLVYSDAEVSLLRQLGFTTPHLRAINNGLNQDAIDAASQAWDASRLRHWQAEAGLDGRQIVLSSARLEHKNKFEQVVEVVARLAAERPQLLWCVIGDGAAREALQRQVAERGLQAHVRWLGAMHGEDRLAPWFLSAQALVHPGAIGLSLLHAFGYGLPVVTHSNALTHGPEFAAMRDGEHGVLYPEDDVDGLARALQAVLDQPALRSAQSAACLARVHQDYNTRTMAERFVECLAP